MRQNILLFFKVLFERFHPSEVDKISANKLLVTIKSMRPSSDNYGLVSMLEIMIEVEWAIWG